MFVKFITSKLLRVIVCAAAGLYGLYNAISCFWECWYGSSSKERKNCGKRPQSGKFTVFL